MTLQIAGAGLDTTGPKIEASLLVYKRAKVGLVAMQYEVDLVVIFDAQQTSRGPTKKCPPLESSLRVLGSS